MEEEFAADDIKRRMQGAQTSLRQELATLRTGRASANMLDPVMVTAYGSQVPVSQCATVSVPEPRMISVSVWDKDLVSTVDKAIRESGLGVNPVVEGTLIRIPIPELNEERRREFAKLAGTYAENARVAIRNVRRHGMERLRKAKAEGMSEDEHKLWSDEIQDITDANIKKVDDLLESKRQEIMTI